MHASRRVLTGRRVDQQCQQSRLPSPSCDVSNNYGSSPALSVLMPLLRGALPCHWLPRRPARSHWSARPHSISWISKPLLIPCPHSSASKRLFPPSIVLSLSLIFCMVRGGEGWFWMIRLSLADYLNMLRFWVVQTVKHCNYYNIYPSLIIPYNDLIAFSYENHTTHC